MIVNFVLVWFSREQSKRLSYVTENISDLTQMVQTFQKHLKDVYSLEAFYGDETLEALLLHAKSLVSILNDEYSDMIDIFEPPELLSGETEDEEDEEEITQIKQDVFYAGTRRSNS